MGPRRAVNPMGRTLVTVALAASVMLGQCVCQNNRPDDPHGVHGPDERPPAAASPEVELPPSLDVSELDADERAILHEVLTEQYDPCGSPRSFLESLADPAPCALARELGDLAVTRVAQGLSARLVGRALLQELGRRATRVELDVSNAPAWGDPGTSSRVLVKFTDFECPHCRTASQPAKDLAQRHGAVLYVKMMPLRHHKHAREAARAALAADRQGRFWQVYDLFFAQQERIRADASAIRELVAEAGVDMARFDDDMADPALKALLERDITEAAEAGVTGTPTFFVDGFMVDFKDLSQALAAAAGT